MANVVPIGVSAEDAQLVMLAREIAVNLRPLEAILAGLGISSDQFEQIKALPRFTHLLGSFSAEWEAAGNTYERTKIKAAMMMEDWLPEAHQRLHDKSEVLSSKVNLGQLIVKLAGMGDHAEGAGSGERVSVTINLGGDTKLKFEQQLAPKVIDAEAQEAA